MNNTENWKVYEMNDCDYVAAKSEEEAKQWYEKFISREEIDEQFEGEVSLDKKINIYVNELTDIEFQRIFEVLGGITLAEDNYNIFIVTLGDWLKVMLDTSPDEPFILASTEV